MKDVGYNVRLTKEEVEDALRERAARKLGKVGRTLDPSDQLRFQREAEVFVGDAKISDSGASVTWTE
jgi:hypothetical protein